MTDRQVTLLRRWMMGLFGLLALVQVFVFPTEENITSVAIALAFTMIVALAMVRGPVLRGYPISAFCILVYWMATVGLAMVATLLDGHPLVYNLNVPERTFLMISLTGLTLIGTHILYRSYFQIGRTFVSDLIVTNLGLFRRPSNLQIWLIGGVGLLAFAALTLTANSQVQAGEARGGGALMKLVQGFKIFAYAPFVLPFLAAMERAPQAFRLKDFFLPGIYFLFLAAVCIGANARGAMVLPIVMIVFSAALLVACGQLSLKVFSSPLWIGLGLTLLLSVGALSDFALAMQAARAQRGQVSAGKMLSLSLEIFGDAQKMKQFEQGLRAARYSATWDETYADNILFTRFMMTKYHDLSLNMGRRLGPRQKEKLANFVYVRSVSVLPAPVVNNLPFGFRKTTSTWVSVGDYTYGLLYSTGYGALRTGSFIASGLAIMGGFFYPALAAFAVLIFTLCDSLVMTAAAQRRFPPGSGYLGVAFIALLNIYGMVNIFQVESIDYFVVFLLRTFWQVIALYCLMIFGMSLVGIRSARRAPIPAPGAPRPLVQSAP